MPGPTKGAGSLQALEQRQSHLAERREQLTSDLKDVNDELELIEGYFTRICKEIQPRD
jgi:predicted  nucleic acid-binding Zn-ribbon protein